MGSNPLSGGVSGAVNTTKIESLAGAVLITDAEWKAWLSRLKDCENNEERLAILDKEKAPFLFIIMKPAPSI